MIQFKYHKSLSYLKPVRFYSVGDRQSTPLGMRCPPYLKPDEFYFGV